MQTCIISAPVCKSWQWPRDCIGHKRFPIIGL